MKGRNPTAEENMDDMGLAASTLGVMLLILREKYTDAQIKKMLTRKKLSAMLKVLNEDDTQ